MSFRARRLSAAQRILVFDGQRFLVKTAQNGKGSVNMWNVKLSKQNATRASNKNARTLADLSAGQHARISCVQCEHAASCERLMAYGLVQGQSVLLVQKHPAFVIRVDETELALDELVAQCIQIIPE